MQKRLSIQQSGNTPSMVLEPTTLIFRVCDQPCVGSAICSSCRRSWTLNVDACGYKKTVSRVARLQAQALIRRKRLLLRSDACPLVHDPPK